MSDELLFGEWLPDVRDYKNPGLLTCRNAIPTSNGYQPVLEPVETGATIPGTVLQARGFTREDGSPVACVATTADLYLVVSGTVTASSLSLALSDDAFVVFERFGDAIYATSKEGGTWVLPDIETSTTFSVAPGTPPQANAMGRIGDFLIMGDLEDIDASNAPYRIRWSQFNNPGGSWGTDIATQSGATPLDPEYGPITAISGGRSGLIFQRKAISRLTYTGGGTVFDLSLYETNNGCIAPNSVVQIGGNVYYLSSDGFTVTDGSNVSTISRGKVWDFFLDRVIKAYLKFVKGVADYKNRCIVWSFPDFRDRFATSQLWYNWETSQWSYVQISTQAMLESAKDGVTGEQFAVLYPNPDAVPQVSPDSPEFAAQDRDVAFIISNKLTRLTGDALEAEFETGDYQPSPGRRSFIREVHPLAVSDINNFRLKVGTRDRTSRSWEFFSKKAGPLGYAPFNVDGWNFRLNLTIPRGEVWSDAIGLQVARADAGAV